MTETERRYDWRAGFQASKSDPRAWSGILVTIVAIWLFLSAPTGNAELQGIYVAGSIALAFAGFPRPSESAKDVAQREARRVEDERRGLDENRRVALMALSAGTPGERHAELAATVVNALTYHSHVHPPQKGRDLLQEIQSGQYLPAHSQIQEWIDELRVKHGDQPMFRVPNSAAS
jgi:hypothetical protein